MKIIEMTAKGLEYYINFVYEGVASFERIEFNFERSSTVCKMLSNSITGKSFTKGSIDAANSLLSYFKKLPQPPQTSTTTSLISDQK